MNKKIKQKNPVQKKKKERKNNYSRKLANKEGAVQEIPCPT